MCRAIASSLSAKVFLLTAALLAVGCLALYVAVALALRGRRRGGGGHRRALRRGERGLGDALRRARRRARSRTT